MAEERGRRQRRYKAYEAQPSKDAQDLDYIKTQVGAPRSESIRLVLQKLPEKERVALKALYVEGLSKAIVCELSGFSLGELNSLVRRVSIRFRTEYMKAYLEERQVPRALKSHAETAVIAKAVEVIGDRSEALRWMGTPVRALNYATPVSLLGTPKGREAVVTVLGRLEHGVL